MASYTTRIVLLLLLIAIVVGVASSSRDTSYEASTSVPNTIQLNTNGDEIGQTHLLTVDGGYSSIIDISILGIYIKKVGSPGTLTLSVYDVDGSNYPTGSALCSGTISSGSVGTSMDWEFADVSSCLPTHIHSPTTYALGVTATGLSVGSNYYVLGDDSGNPYSDGSEFTRTIPGAWSIQSGYDLGFQTYYILNRVPTASTLSSPTNGQTGIPTPTTLSWNAATDPDGDTVNYDIDVTGGTISGCGDTTSLSCVASNLESNTTYTWDVTSYDADEIGGTSASWTFTTADFIPPASITNLSVETVTSSSIKWNWTNPIDVDFNKVMVYKNGAFLINTSNNYYTMGSLTGSTNYTISTHTVDNAGNINSTWVNLTQKTSAACGSDSVCQLENGSVMYWTNSTYRYAQTVLITTLSPYDAIVELDALWLNVSKTGTPGDITIEIMETNATDYPSDHDITCTATLAEADVSTSFTLESISLPNDPTKGYTCTGQGSLAYISFGSPTTLAFAITATGLNASNYYSYRMSPTKTFADGYLYLDSSGLYVEDVYDGVWVRNTTNDLYFELFYHPNRRPNAPTNTAPSNNANNTSVALNLEWSAGSDDDGDSLTYTPIVSGSSSFSCSLISGLSCFVSSLTTNTTYDWYIVPTDPWQIGTNSTTWNFTTRPPFNDTYVKWNGSDTASGEDWDNALDTISYAINYSVNSVYSIIHIGMGNYSADPEITVGTLAMFWADTSGPMQNTSEVWVDMPSVNISS